jgi:hypothetical protein
MPRRRCYERALASVTGGRARAEDVEPRRSGDQRGPNGGRPQHVPGWRAVRTSIARLVSWRYPLRCQITVSRFAPLGCRYAIRCVHSVASRTLHGQFPVTPCPESNLLPRTLGVCALLNTHRQRRPVTGWILRQVPHSPRRSPLKAGWAALALRWLLARLSAVEAPYVAQRARRAGRMRHIATLACRRSSFIAALWAVFCLPGKMRELKQDREMQERCIAAMTDDELAAEIEATTRWPWGRHR